MVDPEAAQLLRRAIQLGNAGRTTMADLRQAIEHPIPLRLPPSRLQGDAPLARVLRRAIELAREHGSEMVGRQDLLLALYEAEAVQLGLSLNRLRFVRAYVSQTYGGMAPAQREVRSEISAPPTEPTA
jgi:hypothetical protein